MEHLTYTIDEVSFKGYYIPDIYNRVRRAINEWQKILGEYVTFYEFEEPTHNADITIRLGKVENRLNVAECKDLGNEWIITFAKDLEWDLGKTKFTNWLRKALGLGERFDRCILHEIGHVFDFPHSQDEDDVMHHNTKVNTISLYEAQHLKLFYKEHNGA